MGEEKDLLPVDFRALAEFRYQIRKFLRFSEDASRAAGLEPQQHQLLLAVKGMPDGMRACIGEIAERLQIQHHSTVELVDRLERHGYVSRKRNERDKREVLIVLTPKAERVLRDLTLYHQQMLQTYGTALVGALKKAMATKDRGKKEKVPTARLRSKAVAAQD